MTTVNRLVVIMNKIASSSISTGKILLKVIALFGLVFYICLLVFEELVESMSELASFVVGTVTKFNKTTA